MPREEEWLPIVGYEDTYSVSNLGRVKNHRTGRVLRQMYDDRGYKRLMLHKNAKAKNFKTHRLVALAFVPNPENKPQVNHINGVKDDNRVENLEWTTAQENMLHSYRALGHAGHNAGLKRKDRRLSDEQIRAIRSSTQPLKTLSEQYGLAKATVCNIRAKRLFKDVV